MAYKDNYYGGGYNRAPAHTAQGEQRYNREKAKPEPIKAEPLPADYLDKAEELMREEKDSISTSKIRRLYSMVTDVYNRERLSTENELSPESTAAIGMMRVRFAYEAGRDKNVKSFITNAKLMNYLKGIGDSREKFMDFAKYMEALIAYHKFFGGKENQNNGR